MTDLISRPRPRTGPAISWPRLAIAGAVATVTALAAAELVDLAAAATGLVDRGVVLPSLVGMGPLSPASVAASAAAATIGAGILLGVLVLVTRRPLRYFRAAATVLGLASLSMPATIPGPPAGMRAAMASMHLAVWAVSVFLLPAVAGVGGPRE